MNSYPAELLYHHFPCMVVTGLTPSSSPVSNPSTTASANGSAATAAAAASAAASTSPPAAIASSSKSTLDAHPTHVFPELTKSLQEILSSRGRNTLWDPARGRAAVFHTVFTDHNTRLPPHKTKPSAKHFVASNSSSNTTTNTGGSTNAVQVTESASSAFSSLAPRSPLSPLHPNSPLFPDGLIAPIWVRKHRELIPAVFVAFHCLPSLSSTSIESAALTNSGETLKRLDEELIRVISERKRSLTERGIKLTIVLLTHREMLEDGQLEARLSYIRRSSGLDSRASLFVLTPVTKPELSEFVTSLHTALFESAIDFYKEHARRVRRKRTRYPPPQSTLSPIYNAISLVGTSSGYQDAINWLSREGWIVRSEYKLAVFAEFIGDNQEALLRYKEAYEMLCMSPTSLLGSTLMLPPRTKRWAEAKVLADTIAFKICKLLLYNYGHHNDKNNNDDTINNHNVDNGDGGGGDAATASAVMKVFRRHISRFTELSTGWGIGTSTFEYWSWLSKQYKLFAELLEQSTKPISTSPLPSIQLPVHSPRLPSKLLHPDALPLFQDLVNKNPDFAPPLGMLTPNNHAVASATIPANFLQSPGTYYYIAALCILERRDRFLKAKQARLSTTATTPTTSPSQGSKDELSPPQQSSSSTETGGPFSVEEKVDYVAILLELFTKSYECFKRTKNGGSSRTALMIASRIATTYFEGQQYQMALKFFERIIKGYSKDGSIGDGTEKVKSSLVLMATDCAIKVGDLEATLRLALDVLDPLLPIHKQDRDQAVLAIRAFLSSPQVASQTDGQDTEGGMVKISAAPISMMHSAVAAAKTRLGILDVQTVFATDRYPAGSSSSNGNLGNDVVECGERILFQIRLGNVCQYSLDLFGFTTLTVSFGFTDLEGNSTMEDGLVGSLEVAFSGSVKDDGKTSAVTLVDVGEVPLQGQTGASSATKVRKEAKGIDWRPRSMVVLQGFLIASIPGRIGISKVILGSKMPALSLEVDLDADAQHVSGGGAVETGMASLSGAPMLRNVEWLIPTRTKGLSGPPSSPKDWKMLTIAQRATDWHPGSVIVKPRSYNFSITSSVMGAEFCYPRQQQQKDLSAHNQLRDDDASKLPCAYLDEMIPLTFVVSNQEKLDSVSCRLEFCMQGLEDGAEQAGDQLTLEEGGVRNRIEKPETDQQRRIRLEIPTLKPGQSRTITLQLLARGRAGRRVVDVRLRTAKATINDEGEVDGESGPGFVVLSDAEHMLVDESPTFSVSLDTVDAIKAEAVVRRTFTAKHSIGSNAGLHFNDTDDETDEDEDEEDEDEEDGEVKASKELSWTIQTHLEMVGIQPIQVSSIRIVSEPAFNDDGGAPTSDATRDDGSLLGEWVQGDRFRLDHVLALAKHRNTKTRWLEIEWIRVPRASRSDPVPVVGVGSNVSRFPIRLPTAQMQTRDETVGYDTRSNDNDDDFVAAAVAQSPTPAQTQVQVPTKQPTGLVTSGSPIQVTLFYPPHLALHESGDLDLCITYNPTSSALLLAASPNGNATLPHPSTLSLVLHLESNANFVFAATRKLTFPFPLVSRSREVKSWARIMPLTIGTLEVPPITVKLLTNATQGASGNGNANVAGNVVYSVSSHAQPMSTSTEDQPVSLTFVKLGSAKEAAPADVVENKPYILVTPLDL